MVLLTDLKTDFRLLHRWNRRVVWPNFPVTLSFYLEGNTSVRYSMCVNCTTGYSFRTSWLCTSGYTPPTPPLTSGTNSCTLVIGLSVTKWDTTTWSRGLDGLVHKWFGYVLAHENLLLTRILGYRLKQFTLLKVRSGFYKTKYSKSHLIIVEFNNTTSTRP